MNAFDCRRLLSAGLLLGMLLLPAKIAWAEEIRDLEFANVEGVSLTLDGFIPEGKGPFPTCILVHGGGFMRGDKQSYIKPLFEPLSRAGFAWFTINYRLAPTHRWPACADDVAAAIRWARANAKQYKLDPGRFALIGESAGGHLVSWAGTQARGDTNVAAVVAFYAPNDLAVLTRHRQRLSPSMTALFGLTELNDSAWQTLRDASPGQQIHSGMPPFLLIHGDADEQVPLVQSTLFQERMQAAGALCDLVTVEKGVHGMGAWAKINSDYQTRLLEWLKTTLVERTNKLSAEQRREQVRAGLQSKEAEVRRIAIRALPHSEVADSLVSETIAALADSDAEVRSWAGTVLGPRGGAALPAVPKLIAQLQNDPVKECRETAARALGRIGKASPESREMIPPLERAGHHDSDSVTRVVALGALALIEPESESRVSAVAQFLNHNDSLTRMKAAHALGYLGKRAASAAPEIAKALQKSTVSHERGYLGRALGQIGDPAQLPILQAEFLRETDERAKGEMAGAIRRLSNPK